VYLTLTDDCNLNCVYCYAKARIKVKNLDAQSWYTIVDRLLSFSDPLTFIFTGGEPLLVPYLFDIATYIKNQGSTCILLTNGTMINNDDISRSISECFEIVKVSLDSHLSRVNSKLRGRETLEKVISALRLLENAKASYLVLSTVNQLNKDDIDNFAKYFNNKVYFQPLYRMGSANNASGLFISGNEYYDALTKSNLFKYLSDYHRNIHGYRGKPIKRCSMASEELSVGPNGDLYPCHLLHYPELKIGNILSGKSIEDLYSTSNVLSTLRALTVDTITQCKNCFVKNFCSGGCRARLDFYKDGLDGKDSFCIFEKRLILDALLYSYG